MAACGRGGINSALRPPPRADGRRSHNIRLAYDGNAVNGRSPAGEEPFARDSVSRDDPVQLVLGGAQMVTNQFAEHGAIIIPPLQISVAGAKHRAINPAGLVGRTGDPPNGIVRMAAKNTGGVAFVIAFHRA